MYTQEELDKYEKELKELKGKVNISANTTGNDFINFDRLQEVEARIDVIKYVLKFKEEE